MSIAIFDDLLAVAIIAVFYTHALSGLALLFSLGCVLLLFVYNRSVSTLPPFIFAGIALWVTLLDSGVNPTIAGVALGLLLPLPMGKRVMHFLHGPIAFAVVPVFVFANAGIPFSALSPSGFTHPVCLGIAGGLFFGKQLGIFITTFLMVRLKVAPMPQGTNWLQLYSVALLCGIGFTMSLFIGSLAFGNDPLMLHARLGVVTGSLASAVAGIICMAITANHKKVKP